MRTGRISLAVVAAATIVLAHAGRTATEDGEYVVIVNPENPIGASNRDLLRDAYLKKATEWPNGETIRPINLSSRFTQRDRFTHEVLRKTPPQLKAYWNQQIFSGKGVPPPEANAVGDVIDYVLAHPGGVGYIPARADPGRAKVVRIK